MQDDRLVNDDCHRNSMPAFVRNETTDRLRLENPFVALILGSKGLLGVVCPQTKVFVAAFHHSR